MRNVTAREPFFTFLLTGGATRADTGRVGFAIRRWLRRQPLRVQCVVFGVFALIGGVLLGWTCDWRLAENRLWRHGGSGVAVRHVRVVADQDAHR
jgi:hypothetical protein